MSTEVALTLLVLGASVWFFGNRLWLLGAGAGALLGFALTELFPDILGGSMQIAVIVGLAVLLAILAFFGKAFLSLIAMGVGFVVGGGLALALLGNLGIASGWLGWVLALVAGVIVALLFSRFLDWSLVIFAALLGSLLLVRGLTFFFPDILDEEA